MLLVLWRTRTRRAQKLPTRLIFDTRAPEIFTSKAAPKLLRFEDIYLQKCWLRRLDCSDGASRQQSLSKLRIFFPNRIPCTNHSMLGWRCIKAFPTHLPALMFILPRIWSKHVSNSNSWQVAFAYSLFIEKFYIVATLVSGDYVLHRLFC